MTQQNGIFYFDFYDADTESEDSTVFAFVIDKSVASEIDNGIEESWYENIFDELESEYGVHDWSSSPADGVPAIGYTSYEVEADRQEELVVKWRHAFASKFGEEKVSKVVRIGRLDNLVNDLDILKKTESILGFSVV